MPVTLIKQTKNSAIVRGSGESMLDVGAEFKEIGAELLSSAYDAWLRTSTEGKENIGNPIKIKSIVDPNFREAYWSGHTYGTYTDIGVEVKKGEPPILTRKSRLLPLLNSNLPEEFWKSFGIKHIHGYGFVSDVDFYTPSLRIAGKDENKPAGDRSEIVLPGSEGFYITPEKNLDILNFLMKDDSTSERYLKFCHGRELRFDIPHDLFEGLEDGQTKLGLLYFDVPNTENEKSSVYGFRTDFLSNSWGEYYYTRGAIRLFNLRNEELARRKAMILEIPKIGDLEDVIWHYETPGP